MKEFLGKDLADWRIEIWYELRLFDLKLSMDKCRKGHVAGYFTDKNLAIASGTGRARYGGDGAVDEAYVLTKDGTTGFIINANQVALSEQATIRAETIEKVKNKLTAEEKKLLGID